MMEVEVRARWEWILGVSFVLRRRGLGTTRMEGSANDFCGSLGLWLLVRVLMPDLHFAAE